MSALTALFAIHARSKPKSSAMQQLFIEQDNLNTLLPLAEDQAQRDYYIAELARVDGEIAAQEAAEAATQGLHQ